MVSNEIWASASERLHGSPASIRIDLSDQKRAANWSARDQEQEIPRLNRRQKSPPSGGEFSAMRLFRQLLRTL